MYRYPDDDPELDPSDIDHDPSDDELDPSDNERDPSDDEEELLEELEVDGDGHIRRNHRKNREDEGDDSVLTWDE